MPNNTTDNNRREKIRLLFTEAYKKNTPQEITQYLNETCGSDAELRKELESLLEAYEKYGDFLENSPIITDTIQEDSTISEGPGTIIGRYKLLEKIGEGGMAVVYMAEQTEPIHRKVALKIIKLGMDTKQVIARFEAERQALALLDHPNIAKVLDAGSTDTGRPYFVMELVKGVSITEYCDKNNFSTKERLELFIQVCNAVQHAHTKGIIHRDIKPSNIMVTMHDGKATVKVIDFGIAKAINQRLTEKTLFTRYAHIIGTPAYMSPEQAQMSDIDIDIRTDIYSLGVLLYELLTGTTPFSEEELRKAGYLEMQRVIIEQEPIKPSTKLTSLGKTLTEVAKHRNSTPNLLTKAVRGDLDWIVMKSLEKDRVQRYVTAAEFAADINRQIRHEPVHAAAPSTLYKMRKFVRRHRIGVSIAGLFSLVILIILLTLSTSTVMIFREQRRTQAALESEKKALLQETQARIEAERQTKIAQTVADFLNNDLLASVDPAWARGREVTVREIMDIASYNIEGRFKDEPLIEASIHLTLGNTYTKLGEYEEAARHLERARRLHEENLQQDDPEGFRSMKELGWLYINQGRYKEAESLLVKVMEISERVLGKENWRTLIYMNDLAVLFEQQGLYEKAEPLYLQTLEIQKRVLDEENLGTLNTMNNLALLYDKQGRYDEAEVLYQRTIKGKTSLFGEDHPDTLRTMNNLAILFREQNRFQEAELLEKKILDIRIRVLSQDHPDTLGTMNNLALLYHEQGRDEEAETLYIETLELKKRVLGGENPSTLNTQHNLAVLYKDLKRYKEAEPLFQKTVEVRERVLRQGHPDTIKTLRFLFELYDDWGKSEEAKKWRTKFSQMINEELFDKPAPVFTLRDLNGQQINLSDFIGMVVLLNFWDISCPPCVEEISQLEILYKNYKEQDLVIIGLNDEPDHNRIRQFAQDNISYTVLINAERQFIEYGAAIVPVCYYIDREGIVRYQDVGFSKGMGKDIEARIKGLLNPKSKKEPSME
ncbi:MAG: tetratricopeptide repeat protein [Sedimentisphaerales bacterium]|nr:tetratricopeptide repeat protein [Sedimentisphaerales bacterium]